LIQAGSNTGHFPWQQRIDPPGRMVGDLGKNLA
jgi:hypothetical protein